MHAWTDIATAIGELLTLATAGINLGAAIQNRHHRSRNQQDPHNSDRKPDGR